MKGKSTFEHVKNNPFLYIVIGVVLAILIARSYVYLGGDVNLTVNGISFHHFFIGIILVISVGLASFLFYEEQRTNMVVKRILALLFGAGIGFIVDEANFFISAGQVYTLNQYYSAANISSETVIVIVLVALFVADAFLHSKIRNRRRR